MRPQDKCAQASIGSSALLESEAGFHLNGALRRRSYVYDAKVTEKVALVSFIEESAHNPACGFIMK